jgi:hypothetical protein
MRRGGCVAMFGDPGDHLAAAPLLCTSPLGLPCRVYGINAPYVHSVILMDEYATKTTVEVDPNVRAVGCDFIDPSAADEDVPI